MPSFSPQKMFDIKIPIFFEGGGSKKYENYDAATYNYFGYA